MLDNKNNTSINIERSGEYLGRLWIIEKVFSNNKEYFRSYISLKPEDFIYTEDIDSTKKYFKRIIDCFSDIEFVDKIPEFDKYSDLSWIVFDSSHWRNFKYNDIKFIIKESLFIIDQLDMIEKVV